MFTLKLSRFSIRARASVAKQVRDFTIAIDGPAASGKSSTARAVAQDLGFGYIDSGSIYRCVTLAALRNGITENKDSSEALASIAEKARIDISINTRHNDLTSLGTGKIPVPEVKVTLDGKDVSQDIRTPEVDKFVSEVASNGSVRSEVLKIQRSLAAKAESGSLLSERVEDGVRVPCGVVMDGRDIGTTIFPNAELKIYLNASPMARAIRRWEQANNAAYSSKGQSMTAKDKIKSQLPSVEDIANELEQRDYADINRKHSPLRIAEDAVVLDNTHLTFEEQVYKIADIARERMGLKPRYGSGLSL